MREEVSLVYVILTLQLQLTCTRMSYGESESESISHTLQMHITAYIYQNIMFFCPCSKREHVPLKIMVKPPQPSPPLKMFYKEQ